MVYQFLPLSVIDADVKVFRVRYQISSASPVNFVQESARLAELIKSYHI
jgi:hypothetical protein